MDFHLGEARRLWRTLAPLPPHTHAFRLANGVRKRFWRPLLPALVAMWRQRGRELARRTRREALLALGAELAAAPSPPADDLLAGRFVLGGRCVAAFPPDDWRLPGARPLEVYEASYLQWTDALVAAALAAEHDATRGGRALTLLADAMHGWGKAASHLDKAWEPYPRARRLLACLAAAARLTALSRHGRDRLQPAHIALREQLLDVAASAVVDLELLLERHLGGNHLLVNRVALAAAEATWGSGDAARRAALEEIALQFPGDGAHVEGSPMYHALLLEDLLELRALLVEPTDPTRERLDAAIARAGGWLAAVRHPDGHLPGFGDTDPAILLKLALTRTALGHIAPTVPDPRQSAWISRHGGHFAIMHCAQPAWEPQPGHAHADHLSVEWSYDDRRILADAGLAGYEGDPHRELNRSEASHSTLEIAGVPSIELWATFRVGARGRVRSVQWGHDGSWDWVAAVHEWPHAAYLHQRLVAQHPRGRLLIVDRLRSRQEPREGVGRLLLAPGVALGDEQTLVHSEGSLKVEANAPLQAAVGLRFSGRGETREGPELRYPIEAGGGTWILLGGDADTDLGSVQEHFKARWHALAAEAEVG